MEDEIENLKSFIGKLNVYSDKANRFRNRFFDDDDIRRFEREFAEGSQIWNLVRELCLRINYRFICGDKIFYELPRTTDYSLLITGGDRNNKLTLFIDYHVIDFITDMREFIKELTMNRERNQKKHEREEMIDEINSRNCTLLSFFVSLVMIIYRML